MALQKFLVETNTGGNAGGDTKTVYRVEPDDIRLILSVVFSVLFALTIVAAFVFTFLVGGDASKQWTTMKDVLGVLLPAETGLLGSILGFYFGSKGNAPGGKTTVSSQSPEGDDSQNEDSTGK